MATLADFTAKIDSLKLTADAILAKIQALESQINAGGLTGEEEASVLAELEDLKTHLDAAQNA